MRDISRIIGTILCILLVLFLLNINVAAKPTVNNITTIPENPEPLSDVTIIVDISGENISTVNLTISGCNETLCFTDLTQRVTMFLNQDGKYQAEITLKDSEGRADHIEYYFKIALENGTEYYLSENSWKTYLDLGEDNDLNNDDVADDSTPGFELIFVMLAIFIGLLHLKKKR